MSSGKYHCAFLSTENVREDVVDDHHAVEPLARLGIDVSTHPWRASDVDWSGFDLVIVRSTWDYHEHVDDFFAALERIEDGGARLANPRQLMSWNRRKTYLQSLQGDGVPIVETVFGDAMDAATLSAVTDRFGGAAWIIKPDIGASAHGVIRLAGRPDAAQRRQILDAFATRGFLAQPFIEDVVAAGEYSVFFFGNRYSHSILKTPCAGDFRVQEEYGSHIGAVTPSPELMRAAEHVCERLPQRGLYERIDLVRDATGAYVVMEVELIEPSLYLRTEPQAGANFAAAILRWLQSS